MLDTRSGDSVEHGNDTCQAIPFLGHVNLARVAAASIAHFMITHLHNERYGKAHIVSEATALGCAA
ncbi:MAG: hypothetical protein ACE5NJ_04020 [Thermodesulfobacteriota bacterium]